MNNIHNEIDKINRIRFDKLMINKKRILKRLSIKKNPLLSFDYILKENEVSKNKDCDFIFVFKEHTNQENIYNLFKKSINILNYQNDDFIFSPYFVEIKNEKEYILKCVVGVTDRVFYK